VRLREALELIDKLRGMAKRPGESDARQGSSIKSNETVVGRAPRWC
jgi:hypothetical protein